jgi:hypothetical protein
VSNFHHRKNAAIMGTITINPLFRSPFLQHQNELLLGSSSIVVCEEVEKQLVSTNQKAKKNPMSHRGPDFKHFSAIANKGQTS